MTKTKKIHKEIEILIAGAGTILISSHVDPDGDSLGSQLALRRYLVSLGKKVWIVNHGSIPSKYMFLPDIDRIVLVDNFKAEDRFDLAIILECPDPDRTGDVKHLIGANIPMINIDHHPDNSGYGKIAHLDSGASAVAEMLTEYFLEVGYKIEPQAATQLYTAIITDTGRFRFSSTTRKTMEIAGRLIELGADPRYISDNIYYSFSESTMRLIGKVFSKFELFDNGKICLMALDNDMMRLNDFNSADTEGMAEYTLFGRGVIVGGLLKEMGEGSTKISLRSRNRINVGEVAHRYGGGGHNNAAGFQIDLPLKAAQEKILKDLREIVDGAV